MMELVSTNTKGAMESKIVVWEKMKMGVVSIKLHFSIKILFSNFNVMDTLTKHTLKHHLTFLLLISQIFHSQIFIFCKIPVKSNYKQQP